MKKTIIFASVALATLFAFSSCQKEALQDNESTNGVRIITAEFENNGTKTTLSTEDNKTPLWKEGDIIRVFGTRASGNQYDDIKLATGNINNGGKSITFTTDLSGTLYAVYPASATTMISCTDGNINFTIPAVQDGTFASANICVAKSTAIDGTNKDNLVFRNATSVLEFSQTASSTKVLRVAVTATNAIAGELTASFGDNNKATISTGGLTGKIIYTTAAATAQDKYYVAVAPVETGAITFNYYKALEETSESKTTKTLALNKIYALTIPTEDYTDSYVEITMTVGVQEKTYKLAKCNIGATKETDYGRYYAWGDIIGQAAATSGTGAFATAFSWGNCPFNNGISYYDSNYFNTDKQNEVCPGGVLANDYDVANKVLGGNWRMPTKEEFEALCSLTKEWKYDYNNSGVNGYLFTDKNSHSIFLPAAGNGINNGLNNAGSGGNYWSSSYTDTANAYRLSFNDEGEFSPQGNYNRFCGFSVRPVSD